MTEAFFSGYCRVLDGARTVLVEDGEADCEYPDCPYAQSCPIGKQITAAQYRAAVQTVKKVRNRQSELTF